MKGKNKTRKAFSPIDCAINDKITIFYDRPTTACLKAWRLTYLRQHDYFTSQIMTFKNYGIMRLPAVALCLKTMIKTLYAQISRHFSEAYKVLLIFITRKSRCLPLFSGACRFPVVRSEFPPCCCFDKSRWIYDAWWLITIWLPSKGQLISEGDYGVYKSPKNKQNFLKDFCPSL